ncbi:Nacht domain protein [Apiospora sp. TS-2023a]
MAAPVHRAFEDAIKKFKEGLDDDPLYDLVLKTTSIDEVYNETDALQKDQGKKGHLRHLSKIEPFLKRLGEYASAIEVFVQVKPDILALIWGPIKLLLQWTSVLKTSFDAIINTIFNIGHYLPDFKSAIEAFHGNAHIYDVLVLFFKDILDFYLIALRIDVVARSIQNHVQLLRHSVSLEDIRQAHYARQRQFEEFEASAKARRQQEFNSIKTDISPVFYDNTLDDFLGRTYEGTGDWLMADATFLRWLDHSDDAFKLLWIQGIPGAGKTFLSSIAVRQAQMRGRTAFAFLSFRDSRGTSALQIIQSLMFQLASRDDDLQSLMIQEVYGNYGRDMSSIASILQKVVNAAGLSYLIVDGLDEIGEIDRTRLLRELLSVSKGCSNLRILIASRPESDLKSLLQDNAKVIRVDQNNEVSIQTFVERWVANCFVTRQFNPTAQSRIRTQLSSLPGKAKDGIEWINTIDEIYTETEVLPESLNEVYERALARINNLKALPSKTKAKQILGWVACSPTP